MDEYHIYEYDAPYEDIFASAIIEDNKLIKVYNGDIVEGVYEIPEYITVIEEEAFKKCTHLEKVIIPSGVTEIKKEVFKDCKSLEEVIIPDTVKSIGEEAFFGCYSLESIIIPDSVKSIGDSAFSRCKQLKKVILPSNIISIGINTFQKCAIESITIPDSITEIKYAAFNNCKSLEEIVIPNSVKSIEGGAFLGCEKLQKVTLSSNITSIEPSTFAYCYSLKSIIIPDNVKLIDDRAFFECESLTEINIPNKVKHIGESAFKGCKSLTKINIPNGVEKIENTTFSNCSSLKQIVLPPNLKFIGNSAFNECKSLTEINIPNGIESIENSTFADCTSLKQIVLPPNLKFISTSAFSECKSLTEINIPSKVKSILEKVFMNCSSLEKVTIENGLTEIKNDVFNGCTSLKELIIPESVKYIGESVIDNCISLKKLVLPGNLEYIDASVNYGGEESIKITTPYGTVINKKYDNKYQTSLNTIYLYLCANSILTNKYQSIDEFLENKHIREILLLSSKMNYNNMNKEFQSLFYKTRRDFDIPAALYYKLDTEQMKKFNYKTWQELKDSMDITSEEMSEAFVEMIGIFGLLEKDAKVEERKKYYKEFIGNKNAIFDKEFADYLNNKILSSPDYKDLVTENMKTLFHEVEYDIYALTTDTIPDEFEINLTKDLTEKEYKNIKKLTGVYGKKINDFVNNNYQKVTNIGYKINEEAIKIVSSFLTNHKYQSDYDQMQFGNPDYVSYATLHRMFDGCTKDFDPDFFEFFTKYADTILRSKKYQRQLKNIQRKFKSIKNYYQSHSGSREVTFKQAINYLEQISFDNVNEGNKEFVIEVKNAGVHNQEAFDYYQQIYEANKPRKMSSLVKRSNIYEINGYKIKTELLRKDDSFGMLVGETNYTNCCQVYNGIGHNCMAHALTNPDGGIFVTKLIDGAEEILLTESWDWQNNNVYCHDNIESTFYLDNNNHLKDAVAEAIRLDALEIINKSKTEVEKYIKERKRTLERSIISEEEKNKELQELAELEKREVIHLVTVGSDNSDIKLDQYYHNSIKVNETNIFNNQSFTLTNFQPVDYSNTKIFFNPSKSAYSDASKQQYIVAGSTDELYLGKNEPLVPIYRDERRVITEDSKQIRDYTISKIASIEKQAYPEDMQFISNGSQYINRGKIILGEDWYLIYEDTKNNSIYISDLAKTEPDLSDEHGIQNQEIMRTINNLISTHNQVTAELKEDTSYLLYLVNKKRGYIEQIGEDIRFSYSDDRREVIDSKTQNQILENAKQIKENNNPDLLMHKITFQKIKK